MTQANTKQYWERLDHLRSHDDAALLLLRRPAAAQAGESAGAPPVADVDGAAAA